MENTELQQIYNNQVNVDFENLGTIVRMV